MASILILAAANLAVLAVAWLVRARVVRLERRVLWLEALAEPKPVRVAVEASPELQGVALPAAAGSTVAQASPELARVVRAAWAEDQPVTQPPEPAQVVRRA